MVDRYYQNQTQLSVEEAREGILNILGLKEAVFGPSYDENAEKMTEMVELLHSNWTSRVQENPTLEQLLYELSEARPVILPFYAPIIKNPHYTGWLDDHVFVLIGYDSSRRVFIVNDPGTRHGERMEFDFDLVMEAINDIGVRWAKRAVFTAPK